MLILLAQREIRALRSLQSCVEECYPGSEIVGFTDVKSAVDYAAAAEEPVDLCFTGVRLYGGTGIGLLRKLRGLDRKVRGVLLADDDTYAIAAWQAGFNDYLIEPLNTQKVRHTLESCMPFTSGYTAAERTYGT